VVAVCANGCGWVQLVPSNIPDILFCSQHRYACLSLDTYFRTAPFPCVSCGTGPRHAHRKCVFPRSKTTSFSLPAPASSPTAYRWACSGRWSFAWSIAGAALVAKPNAQTDALCKKIQDLRWARDAVLGNGDEFAGEESNCRACTFAQFLSSCVCPPHCDAFLPWRSHWSLFSLSPFGAANSRDCGRVTPSPILTPSCRPTSAGDPSARSPESCGFLKNWGANGGAAISLSPAACGRYNYCLLCKINHHKAFPFRNFPALAFP